MEKINSFLKNYQPKLLNLAPHEFQDYVAHVIEDFGIVPPYDKPLWKMGKKNLQFLRGKVESLRESAKYKKEDLKTYGPLLTWSLKNKKKEGG